MSAYMEYTNDDTGIRARWHGGAYIEFGYIAEDNHGPRNNLGQWSYEKGDWVATDVINVWNYSTDKARIPFTFEAFEECVIDHLDEEGML